MEKLRFTSLCSDAGLFLFRNKNSFVIAIIYVDDAIFCGPLPALVNHLKEEFKKIWETRDLNDVTEFLCMCHKFSFLPQKYHTYARKFVA